MTYMSLVLLATILLMLKDTMTKTTTIKENISLALAYSSIGLVHCHHDGLHGSNLASAGELAKS